LRSQLAGTFLADVNVDRVIIELEYRDSQLMEDRARFVPRVASHNSPAHPRHKMYFGVGDPGLKRTVKGTDWSAQR